MEVHLGILTKEKACYVIQTFIMFLNVTRKALSDHQEEIDKNKDLALQLLENVSQEKLGPLQATLELNALIGKMNFFLKAPYPQVTADTEENLVKGEIVAFEHYLNQELKANHLTLKQEAPIFNDSLRLWEKIGVTLDAREGAFELAHLVKKTNQMLPLEEQYPLPDL
jgi:hypothetical protein